MDSLLFDQSVQQAERKSVVTKVPGPTDSAADMMDKMKGFSVRNLRNETNTITSKEDEISDEDMPFSKRPAKRKQTRVELDMGPVPSASSGQRQKS